MKATPCNAAPRYRFEIRNCYALSKGIHCVDENILVLENEVGV